MNIEKTMEMSLMDIEKLIREVSAEIRNDTATANGIHRDHSSVRIISALEHSMLTPTLTESAVLGACAKARKHRIAAVCVPPYYTPGAARALRNSGIAVCAAIGVPNALLSASGRLAEARYCTASGAHELDVSINTMALKSGHPEDAEKDLYDIVQAAKGKAHVKAAVELSLFTEDERQTVLNMIKRSGVEYVKIQNVLSGKGADIADIHYVREILGRNIGIKIDGGVKTFDKARELICGGADRIGLTATYEIINEIEN
jgi:deoxyribose-phosphate aldolase